MFILSDIQCDVGLIAHMSIDSPALQVHCGASVACGPRLMHEIRCHAVFDRMF